MRQHRRHTWLFSFTDIAFLLLLVYTQLSRLDPSGSQVAEIRLPTPAVVKSGELLPRSAEKEYRQVLVDKHSDRPYRLTRIVDGKETSSSGPLAFGELRGALEADLRGRKDEPRPVVVPLPESYSSDLVQAAALVGQLWNREGTAVVHTEKKSGE
jgi:hypothetical protein